MSRGHRAGPGSAGLCGLVVALLLGACGTSSEVQARTPLTIALLRAVPDADHEVFVSELRVQGFRPDRDVRIVPVDPGTLYDETTVRDALRSWRSDGVDLYVAFSTPLARVAAEELPGTPGLFLANDPVSAGLVDDPMRPGGRQTGVTFHTPADRTIDLARRALGDVDHLGYLMPTDDPGVPGHRAAVLAAAEELGIAITQASFTSPQNVSTAVDELDDAGVDAVYVASSTASVRAAGELEAALDAAGLPAMANTDFLSFAVVVLTPDRAEVRRQLARQAARLLAGARTASVPVEDPRKFVLILNAGQVESLGLEPLGRDLLRQADVVR